jgi:HAD superfamily hydrolase (TIGR01509 family)
MMSMSMMSGFSTIKAVLFDCDGTLIDSEYTHYLAWQRALNALEGDLTLSDYYQYVGKSAETIAQLMAQAILNQDCADTLLTIKRNHYKDLCTEGLPPIQETVLFLKKLSAQKKALPVKIGVCSATRKEEILSHLHALGVEDVFDVILSGQEDLKEYHDPEGVNKPKPYIYLHAMKLLGVLPHETVVIEDSASGASAGVAAGCFTIAIPNDYTQHHDFSHTQWTLPSFQGMEVETFLNSITTMQSNTKPKK